MPKIHYLNHQNEMLKRHFNQESENSSKAIQVEQQFLYSNNKNNESNRHAKSDMDKYNKSLSGNEQSTVYNNELVYPNPIRPFPKYQTNSFAPSVPYLSHMNNTSSMSKLNFSQTQLNSSSNSMNNQCCPNNSPKETHQSFMLNHPNFNQKYMENYYNQINYKQSVGKNIDLNNNILNSSNYNMPPQYGNISNDLGQANKNMTTNVNHKHVGILTGIPNNVQGHHNNNEQSFVNNQFNKHLKPNHSNNSNENDIIYFGKQNN